MCSNKNCAYDALLKVALVKRDKTTNLDPCRTQILRKAARELSNDAKSAFYVKDYIWMLDFDKLDANYCAFLVL